MKRKILSISFLFILIFLENSVCGEISVSNGDIQQKDVGRGLGGVVPSPQQATDVSISVKRKRNGGEDYLLNGDSLAQTDNYAIEFRPKESAHVYIFQVDAKEKIFKLFPNTEYLEKNNPLQGGELYRIPDQDRWFYLDENKGKEYLIVLAQKEPLADAENICKKILDSEIAKGETSESEEPQRVIKRKNNNEPKKSAYDNDINNKMFIWKLFFMHR